MDVDAMIEQCKFFKVLFSLIANEELRDYANKRLPLPKKNLSEKDESLLKKVSLLANAVQPEKP